MTVFFANKLMRGNRVQKYSAWDIDGFDSATLEALAVYGSESRKIAKHIIETYRPFWPDPCRHDFYIVRPCQNVGMVHLYPGF